MDEPTLYRYILWGFLVVAALTFPVLFFITAPYGRHETKSWGPTVDNRTGWLLMESPSVLVFFACWYLGGCPTDAASLGFLFLWQLHYVHRAYIFPFRIKSGPKRMPVAIAAFGFTFTSFNAYLNGRWLFGLAGPDRYASAWLSDPRFFLGAAIFLAGFAINQQADWILL
ncbi:MAG TPA: hypothetical protein VM694_21210, partial [Polyangium sp.]|nr:hypothetical protein [Polyangium sp.]